MQQNPPPRDPETRFNWAKIKAWQNDQFFFLLSSEEQLAKRTKGNKQKGFQHPIWNLFFLGINVKTNSSFNLYTRMISWEGHYISTSPHSSLHRATKLSNLPILLGSSPGLFWIRRFLVGKICNPLAPPAKTRPYLLDTASRLERSLGNSSGESKILTFFSALNWKSYCWGKKPWSIQDKRILNHVCHYTPIALIPVQPK